MMQAGTPSEPPLIEVSHVCTRFGAAVVHDDVNLTVHQGELFAIVGGNGSGKSTLLREIILLQRPNAGTVRVFGQNIWEIPEREARLVLRRCGVLFQQGALFSSLTVAGNVAAPLHEHTHLSPGLIREIACVKLALAGFPMDSVSKFPNEISGGMRRRAGLARALALDPDLLFLDEPTAGLDPVSAAGFDELVQKLKATLGLTIVMVTHDLDSLWRVADRVGVLGKGTIVDIGTMEELARSEDPLIHEFFFGPRGRAAGEQARGQPWNQK